MIQTDYNYSGLQVQGAIIRVDRLWGNSTEGWTAQVGVYNVVQETQDDDSVIDVYKLIHDFNFSCEYSSAERGYVLIYNALQAEFGGTHV
jgi:hypothetical protein